MNVDKLTLTGTAEFRHFRAQAGQIEIKFTVPVTLRITQVRRNHFTAHWITLVEKPTPFMIKGKRRLQGGLGYIDQTLEEIFKDRTNWGWTRNGRTVRPPNYIADYIGAIDMRKAFK